MSPEVADAGGARAAGVRGEVAAQVVRGTDVPSSHTQVARIVYSGFIDL